MSTPPTIYANTFNGNYSSGWVYVPKPQDVTTYKATDYWKKFANYSSISPWDFNYNGLYYIITGSNTASVTYRDTESLTYSGDVFVPKTVTYNSVTYNVTGINYGAFRDMRPDNIRGEGTPNLTANTALYSVVIGDNVTTLGGLVFDECTAMHTVDFGPAVTSIGSGSFNQCTALKSVVSRSTTPPTFQSGSYLNGFADYSGTLYVPSSAVNAYKAATYWKNFASVRALPTLNEALNVSGGNITFTSTGDNSWKSMVYNGSFYAMSGNDGAHNSTSTLTATVTVPTGGATLSFDFKAWGEGAGYDKCMFLLDGTIKFNYGARQNDWETYNVELSAGTHTLAWTYSKDSSVNPVGDYFAVRNVKLNIEAYACYTPSNTTLTFYYDGQRASRTGTTYDLNEGTEIPGWYNDGTRNNVTRVVFDSSFANATPTSTYFWFYKMSNLKSISDISNLKTNDVTRMTFMFCDCSQLTSLDLSGFNTANVTIMADMFKNCSALTSLDLSGFNTAQVKNMGGMFEGCTGLTSLDLSSFNTANVTTMNFMFYGCSNLATIYAGNGWTTAAASSQYNYMFTNCTSLVGGQGTTYDSRHVDGRYAHIDGGTANPGYFTDKNASQTGDVNGDSNVTIADVTALIDLLLGSGSVDNPACDVNGDGNVTIADVTALIDLLLSGN